MSCHLAIFNKIAFRRITYLSCLEYICQWRGILIVKMKRQGSTMCQQEIWSQAIAMLAHWTALDAPEELFLRLSLTWHFDYSSAPCPPHHNHHPHQTNKAPSLPLRIMHLSLQLVLTPYSRIYTYYTLTQNLVTRSVANLEVMDPTCGMCSSV